MNKLKEDRFSNGVSEIEMKTTVNAPLDYCSVCFIAFGSQERRITVNKDVVHIDCANKARSR